MDTILDNNDLRNDFSDIKKDTFYTSHGVIKNKSPVINRLIIILFKWSFIFTVRKNRTCSKPMFQKERSIERIRGSIWDFQLLCFFVSYTCVVVCVERKRERDGWACKNTFFVVNSKKLKVASAFFRERILCDQFFKGLFVVVVVLVMVWSPISRLKSATQSTISIHIFQVHNEDAACRW